MKVNTQDRRFNCIIILNNKCCKYPGQYITAASLCHACIARIIEINFSARSCYTSVMTFQNKDETQFFRFLLSKLYTIKIVFAFTKKPFKFFWVRRKNRV